MAYVTHNRTKKYADALVGDPNTIYFTTDSHQIVLNGIAYGESSKVISAALNDLN
jgi:hypothetical protein